MYVLLRCQIGENEQLHDFKREFVSSTENEYSGEICGLSLRPSVDLCPVSLLQENTRNTTILAAM